LSLNSDIAFSHRADLIGLQFIEENTFDFDEAGLKMGRLLISQENGIFVFLNFGIEVEAGDRRMADTGK
jgi:hypothetical protein